MGLGPSRSVTRSTCSSSTATRWLPSSSASSATSHTASHCHSPNERPPPRASSWYIPSGPIAPSRRLPGSRARESLLCVVKRVRIILSRTRTCGSVGTGGRRHGDLHLGAARGADLPKRRGARVRHAGGLLHRGLRAVAHRARDRGAGERRQPAGRVLLLPFIAAGFAASGPARRLLDRGWTRPAVVGLAVAGPLLQLARAAFGT
jgi:hypothetical protein